MSHAFITKVTTLHTGGNCMLDVIELESGHCIAINGEVAVLFPNREAVDDSDFDASDLPTWPLYEETP